MLAQDAHGARGYPERPASDDELDAKFMACATRDAVGRRRRRSALERCCAAIESTSDDRRCEL